MESASVGRLCGVISLSNIDVAVAESSEIGRESVEVLATELMNLRVLLIKPWVVVVD